MSVRHLLDGSKGRQAGDLIAGPWQAARFLPGEPDDDDIAGARVWVFVCPPIPLGVEDDPESDRREVKPVFLSHLLTPRGEVLPVVAGRIELLGEFRDAVLVEDFKAWYLMAARDIHAPEAQDTPR